MKTFRLALLVLPFTVAAAVGPSPVGTWKGHIVIDSSKMTIKDPQKANLAKQQIAAAQKLQITVTIKADKTFTGSPPPTTGTWTIQGNQVTLTANGRPGGQVFVLSKDGKTMTNTMPSSQGVTSKIVLKKG